MAAQEAEVVRAEMEVHPVRAVAELGLMLVRGALMAVVVEDELGRILMAASQVQRVVDRVEQSVLSGLDVLVPFLQQERRMNDEALY